MARRDKFEQKVLDVDASMQGSLIFKDPVNLRINGNFEGKLDTKGSLTIGENASVRADITGEEVIICGKLTGTIIATRQLRVLATGHIVGDITTPVLSVESGAVIQGRCQMLSHDTGIRDIFDVNQLAKYLEVDVSNIVKWADAGEIPAFKEDNEWRFDKTLVDGWVAKERRK